MPIQLQGNSGTVAEVDGTSFRAQRVTVRPIDFNALGHYRYSFNVTSISAQVANSRIFEIRNTGASTLIVPTRLILRAIQTAAGTAQHNAIDVFKVTGFSAVDTTNTTTPTFSVKRTTGMTAVGSAAAAIRIWNGSTVNGMTGGTLTKDSSAFASLPYNVAAAINTTTVWGPVDVFDDVNGTHPFVFAQNEGFIIENRTLNVTSYGITWYVDVSWAEVTAY